MANQTLKAQHQKELEGREEEVEAMKSNMNKKLKTLGDQIEELHEEKQAATKVGLFVLSFPNEVVKNPAIFVQIQYTRSCSLEICPYCYTVEPPNKGHFGGNNFVPKKLSLSRR